MMSASFGYRTAAGDWFTVEQGETINIVTYKPLHKNDKRYYMESQSARVDIYTHRESGIELTVLGICIKRYAGGRCTGVTLKARISGQTCETVHIMDSPYARTSSYQVAHAMDIGHRRIGDIYTYSVRKLKGDANKNEIKIAK